MKTFICLFVAAIIAISLAKTPQEKLHEISAACKSESGISDETLTKVRNHEEVDDPKLKDHALCIMKKTGDINDDGDLQIETIRKNFNEVNTSPDILEKVISKCAVKKDTPKDTAAHFIKCARQVHGVH